MIRRVLMLLFLSCALMVLSISSAVAQEGREEDDRQNFAAAPIVISNPSIGSGLGATGMYFFDIGEQAAGLPRSSAQVVGAYTNTDPYFAGLLGSLHLRQDRIRSKLGVFHASINNEYRDPLGGEADFNTGVLAGFGQISYRVWQNVFIGGQVLVTDIAYDPDTPADGEYLERVGAQDSTATGIGPVFVYDTRDNIHYPGRGTLAELKGFYKPSAWGNEADYAVGDIAALGFDSTYAFGSREEVRPIDHLVGAAAGWGGMPREAAYYETGSVEKNDGKTPYVVTVKDVPVDAFYSITVYNADGYLEKNDLGRNSFNNFSATPNADGSYTIHFGGDPESVNYLPITKDWNYAIRMYQPRKEILDGSWSFPAIEPVK